jgi:hypothetical protein
MKRPFRNFCRNGVYYSEDTDTGKQKSLQTRDGGDAARLISVMNEAAKNPAWLILQIGRIYLSASDPKAATRTWKDVLTALLPMSRKLRIKYPVAMYHQFSPSLRLDRRYEPWGSARGYLQPKWIAARLHMGTWTYVSNLLNEPPGTPAASSGGITVVSIVSTPLARIPLCWIFSDSHWPRTA